MGTSPESSAKETARILWALLFLFCLRVLGQILVRFAGVTWLPPMEQWYSGLMPYRDLLPSQILIICLYTKVCLDLSRAQGYFFETRRWFATGARYFGYVYLSGMIARYPIQMALHPDQRWFGKTIPIFFHWVLSSFIIVFAHHHKHRLARTLQESDTPDP